MENKENNFINNTDSNETENVFESNVPVEIDDTTHRNELEKSSVLQESVSNEISTINEDNSLEDNISENNSLSSCAENIETINVLPHQKTKRRLPKLLSYVAVGVVCSILGGVGASAVLLYTRNNLSSQTGVYSSYPQNKAPKNDNTSVPYTIATNSNNLSVQEIAKKVGPAVVGVSTKSSSSNFPFDSSGQEGMGSGIIINSDGYVLTNYHVISGAQKVKIILSNGKEVTAKIINYDADSDIAVVKITDSIEVPAVAELGDSDNIEVGELAVAIGNPLGKELLGSVTVGVISAVNREIDKNNKTLKYIQTDAAINPGNSGGALVNSKGQVIGINTAKMGGSGVEGLGFAIPINTIKPKLDTLVKPILKIGISGIDITEEIAKENNLPVGFYIKEIQEFSAAEKAGISRGDVIVKFDGEKVTSVNDINKAKNKHKAGDKISVEIIRNGKSKTLELVLTE